MPRVGYDRAAARPRLSMRPIATAREGLGEARVTRRRKAEVAGGGEATIREREGGGQGWCGIVSSGRGMLSKHRERPSETKERTGREKERGREGGKEGGRKGGREGTRKAENHRKEKCAPAAAGSGEEQAAKP